MEHDSPSVGDTDPWGDDPGGASDGGRPSNGDRTPSRTSAVLDAWAKGCAGRDVPGDHCTGVDAGYLVTAVEAAMRRGSHTPHLGRAARGWGSHFNSPGDVVAALSCLREVLCTPELADVSGIGASGPAPPSGLSLPGTDQIHRVLDQVMLEAVDAAAGNLQAAARTDPLTGCPNRRALAEDIRRATSNARHGDLDMAVVAIDLDGLKKINDAQGHAAGDGALLGLVAAVHRSLRESDTLYRVGGDEFVVLAPFTDLAGARELMHRVTQSGGPAFSWGAASLASTRFTPGGDPQNLVQAADLDLYERRRARRRQALFDSHRRRALAAAAVAATVAATVAGTLDVTGGVTRQASPLSPGSKAPTANPRPSWGAPATTPPSFLLPTAATGSPGAGSATGGVGRAGGLLAADQANGNGGLGAQTALDAGGPPAGGQAGNASGTGAGSTGGVAPSPVGTVTTVTTVTTTGTTPAPPSGVSTGTAPNPAPPIGRQPVTPVPGSSPSGGGPSGGGTTGGGTSGGTLTTGTVRTTDTTVSPVRAAGTPTSTVQRTDTTTNTVLGTGGSPTASSATGAVATPGLTPGGRRPPPGGR